MATSKKILLSFGCVLIAAALTAWLFAQHKLHEHRWTVLEKPIRIDSGFLLEQPFTVDVPADYYVEIECSKTLDFDTLDPLLTKKLAATYSVTENGLPLASGDSATHHGASYSRDYISRSIGKFFCAPGHAYQLTLRVTLTLPELASTTPVAKVSVAPIVFKDAFVTASLSAYLAIALGILGIACILPPLYGLVFRRRSRKQQQKPNKVAHPTAGNVLL